MTTKDIPRFEPEVWQRLLKFFSANVPVKRGEGILAAVSGGPDSVCLLHFLSQLSRRMGFRLAVCHVNHGLRGACADADEQFVRELCLREKIPFTCAGVKVTERAARHGLSVEHAARQLRYGALCKAAKKHGCRFIAFGHHLDDHVETVLLNLLRGTNPQGLCGIPVKRPMGSKYPGAGLVRPLLCITRMEVMAYVKKHGLKYRTDETNDSERYTRNWVRKTLLPLLEKKQPRFREHLLQLSGRLEAELRGGRVRIKSND
jgi:tRNA(Ile)-lysidine synthase